MIVCALVRHNTVDLFVPDRWNIQRAHPITPFTHFKTNTKSIDIYRVVRCCVLMKKSKHSENHEMGQANQRPWISIYDEHSIYCISLICAYHSRNSPRFKTEWQTLHFPSNKLRVISIKSVSSSSLSAAVKYDLYKNIEFIRCPSSFKVNHIFIHSSLSFHPQKGATKQIKQCPKSDITASRPAGSTRCIFKRLVIDEDHRHLDKEATCWPGMPANTAN